jgi:hypothetical protein
VTNPLVERYAELASFDKSWSNSRIPLGRLGLPDEIAWLSRSWRAATPATSMLKRSLSTAD